MTKPMLNLSLSTKALLLVAIPLAWQFVSVAYLSFMLTGATRETERVQQSREITTEALLVSKLTYDAAYSIYQYMESFRIMGSPRPSWAEAYARTASQVPKHLLQLRELVADRTEEKVVAERFIKSAAGQLKALQLIKKALDQGNLPRAFSIGVIMSESGGFLDQMSSQLEKLTNLHEKDTYLLESAARSRDLANQLLYVFLIVNAILVYVLIRKFRQDTIFRLNTLMDNTRRFGAGKELNPVVSGSDEIAELDQTFHDMARAMEAANQRERELLQLKQQIIGMVSHDLRAPLTSLQATLNLLNRDLYGDLSAQGHARVTASEQSVNRLIRMINDLLDMERLEAGKLEIRLQAVPLSVIVDRSIESVRELARVRQIDLHYDQSEYEVLTDGDRLIQVLVNLLSNAIKFSPDSATVRITSASSDGFVELRVTDEGPGISKEYRDKIFERYRQIPNSSPHDTQPSSGLGLAICKMIMTRCNGDIGVDDSPAGGSSFWIRMPRAPDEKQHQSSESESESVR